MKTKTIIREAVKTDIDEIIDLCEAHSLFEKADYSRENKSNRLSKDLFSDRPKLYCLIVEFENHLIGYATYMKQYSTWDASEYIYMDCLFIKENFRNLGLGEKLVRKIQKEAKKMKCSLVQWQTPKFNSRAIKFYKRIGATSKSKERFFLDCK